VTRTHQCWQCGADVTQVVRADRVTGWSWGRYPRVYTHRVNLCLACAARQRRSRHNVWYVVLAVVAAIALAFLSAAIVTALGIPANATGWTLFAVLEVLFLMALGYTVSRLRRRRRKPISLEE
jgi:hypothetical protein